MEFWDGIFDGIFEICGLSLDKKKKKRREKMVL